MVNINYCFRRNDEIMCKEFPDRFYLLDSYRRVLMELNETAFEVWGLIDGEHAASQITEAIAEKFNVDKDTAGKDVAGFLKELVKREIIF